MKFEKEDIVKRKKTYRDLLRFSYPIANQRDLKRLRKAYELVIETYAEDWNTSKRDEIYHSIEVAKLVTEEIHLGIPSIISALLHHMVLEERINLIKIKKLFGVEVYRIIEGYITLSKLDTSKILAQSDNFLSLHLSIVQDFRAVLIKLSHRLFDMRNFETYSISYQTNLLNEIEHIYIPIAHRLGLYQIKSELENYWLYYSYPEEYNTIKQQLKDSKKKQEAYVQDFIRPVERVLFSKKLSFTIKQRTKSIYSIWRKIKQKKVDFEEVFDLYAVRIILDTPPKKEKSDCWQVYSIVTDFYSPEPSRLRDWISNPKTSGYESLHTTVQGNDKKWVEVQIRSKRMDNIAENGLAAHWIYKEGGKKKEQEEWLNEIKSLLVRTEDSREKLAITSKLDIKSKEIFVFTPEGDLKRLPQGASVLDFAYSIHSSLGEMCTGARINNKHVPIRHKLESGDRVEIITSKNQSPSADWLNFVVSPRARSRIKKTLKDEKKREAKFGKELLYRRMKNNKLPLDDVIINKLVKDFNLASSMDLYYFIALEKIDFKEIKEKLESKDKITTSEQDSPIVKKKTNPKESTGLFIENSNIEGLSYELAKCCKPVSGDAVFGFITVGKGIVIHRIDCPNASQLLSKYDYRVVDVQWKQSDETKTFLTTLNIIGSDERGVLNKITNLISNNLQVDMKNMKLDTYDEGYFKGCFSVSVHNKTHLDGLIHQLRKINGVQKVSREVFLEN